MAPRLRRMKTYHPRRRAKRLDLNKQSLHDLKHKISSDVGSLIVLIEEGNTSQITQAQQKAKTDFLKHASEMQKIAQKMGDRFTRAVRDYLDSVDMIVHSNATWLDQAKIRHCYTMTEKLEKELGAA
ncbi:MAG: hypothetical protein JSS60_04535 [Verrucomicrobia bacterium]|nr:hypothetical protein [Verrucomicrobiota bacterium]